MARHRRPAIKLEGFYAELVGNLVFVRKQAGLTQKDMSDIISVTRAQITNIETLRSHINAVQLKDWCIGCNCSIQDVWPINTKVASRG